MAGVDPLSAGAPVSFHTLTRLLSRRAAGHSVRSGSRQARTAILFGGLVFGLVSFALALAAETVKPEWRDPEYGHRLRRLERWQWERPGRPLVVVFGSSRAQMGVSPAAMGFPDEPGSPLVYNFGYRGASPVYAWLQLARLLEAGVRPRAVVVMVAALELSAGCRGGLKAPPWWGGRFSERDLRRLAPYNADPEGDHRALSPGGPWSARSAALVSDLLPDWQSSSTRVLHSGWEGMDRYGFAAFPLLPWPEEARCATTNRNREHAARLNEQRMGEPTHRALLDLASRCRAEGIAPAFCWAPEAPSYRAMYTPAGLQIREENARRLAGLGGPVFPSPEHLEETDFADGIHLLPDGAVKYSRWLADRHLKPWLTQVLK